MDSPYLAGIRIYPVKSLEPVSLGEVRLLPCGALTGDRTFALRDIEGKFINGKRNRKIHALRIAYDPQTRTIRLGRAETGLSDAFHVDHEVVPLEAWLSEFFGLPVRFCQDREHGFPDDPDCPGPTVIGAETIREVASWFVPLHAEQIRLRFRANLEIAAGDAFWEDRLFGKKGLQVRFRIGDCLLEGIKPCSRCTVPRAIH